MAIEKGLTPVIKIEQDLFDEAADNNILTAIGRKCHEQQIY